MDDVKWLIIGAAVTGGLVFIFHQQRQMAAQQELMLARKREEILRQREEFLRQIREIRNQVRRERERIRQQVEQGQLSQQELSWVEHGLRALGGAAQAALNWALGLIGLGGGGGRRNTPASRVTRGRRVLM